MLAVGTAAVLALGSTSAWAQTAPAPDGSTSSSTDPRTLPRDQRPAPEGPSVTADASDKGVKVSWKNAPENAESFTVTRSAGNESVEVGNGPVSGHAFVDREASSGQDYTYTVTVAEVDAPRNDEVRVAAASVGQVLGSVDVSTPADDSAVRAASTRDGKRGESRRNDVREGGPAAPVTAASVEAAAHGQCQWSGTLLTSETWSPEDCPEGYQILDDLEIPTGVVLTLLPGTEVMATDSATTPVDITVRGSLLSNGAEGEGNQVTFTSMNDDGAATPAEPGAGDWGNLAFLDSEGGSLSFTEVRYGNKVLADGFALPLNDVAIEQMVGSDPDGDYHRGGVDYRNVPGGATVSITRLDYNGVIEARDDAVAGPDDDDDTGVYLTNYGQSDGDNANTAGFSVSVLDSTISGWFPLYVEHDARDMDSLVSLTATGNTITDTADSTAVFAAVYQGFGDADFATETAGSALLTGTISDNAVDSLSGEGIYLEAQTALSDTTAGAADVTCAAGTFGACNNISLTDNSVSSADSAVMHYAWVDDGPGDVVSAAAISGGSYTSASGNSADIENWTDGSGSALTSITASGITLAGEDGVFSMAGSDGGPAVSSPVLDGVTLTSNYYGWDNEVYAAWEGESAGDATANPVVADSSFTGRYTAMFNYAQSDFGSATANPALSHAELEGGSDAGLSNYAYAVGDSGSATGNPVIFNSTLEATRQYGDALYNDVYSEYGSAVGSPSIAGGSKLDGDWDGDGLYNTVQAGESAASADPLVVPGPTATGSPVISQSHVEGDDSGIYNYVESGTGAATAAPQIVDSSVEAADGYGLANEAYAAEDDGAGAATATPSVADSSIGSDGYGIYNEAAADEGDSAADGSLTLTRASVTAEDDEGVESYAEPNGTGAGTLNPQITSSTISAPGDYGLYLEVYTDDGPGSVGGFINDSAITAYDNALYVDLETTGGADMTSEISGSDLFSEYYETVYIDVEDELYRTNTDADPEDDFAVSNGTSVTPTFTSSRLRTLDDDGIDIEVDGSGDDASDVVELSPVLEDVTISSYYTALDLDVEDDSNYVLDPDSGNWPGQVLLGGSVDDSTLDALDYYGIYAEADCYDCSGGSTISLSAHNTDVYAYDEAGYFYADSEDADATVSSQITSDRGASWNSYDEDSIYSEAYTSGDARTATNDMVVRGMQLGSYGDGVDLEAYSSNGDGRNGSVIDDNVISSPWGDNGYDGIDDYTYAGSSSAAYRTGSISGNTITGKDTGIDHYIGTSSSAFEYDSLVIAGNAISDMNEEGIEADGSGERFLSEVTAADDGSEHVLTISGNTISSTGDDGIDVSGLPVVVANNVQSLSGLDGSGYAGIRVEDNTVQGLVECNTVVGNETGIEYENNADGKDPLTHRNTFALPDGTTNSGLNLETDNAGVTNAELNYFGTADLAEAAATVNNDRNTEVGPQGTVDINPLLPSPPDCSTEPTAVTAVPGNGSATVSWTAPASDAGSEITGYRVTASPGGRTCSTEGALTCTVEGLTNGTAYTFTVVAINAIGDSPPSAPSNSVIPTAPPTVPGTPAATPGDTAATVTWTAPSTDGGTPITGYRVTSAPGGRTCTTTGALSCTVTGLTNGQAYTFSVMALNATGTGPASAPSNSVVPAGVPTAPQAPTATAGDLTATVSWDASSFDGGRPVTSYRVSASPGDGACDAIGTTTCTVDGLANGTAYTFTVTATNAVGTSPESAASNSVTPQMRATTVTGQSSASSSDSPPSASNPLVVSIVSPAPGEFSFTPVTPDALGGWRSGGSAMDIEAPTGTVDNPLRMVFRFDSSALQAGVPVGVFRDGRLATACTGETRAEPDPCQLSQTVLDDGDVQIVVLSTHASKWQVSQPAPGSIGAACAGAAATPFTDVAGNTHHDAIACLVAYEITKGSTATTYAPFGSVTRAQMASFIARALRDAGVSMPSGDKAVFTDVAKGGEHSAAINQLAALDVVEGVTENRYAPEAMVSRAQMASFISRAYERATGLAVPSTASAFGDVAGNTHEANINKIAVLGVTVGRNATTYEPFAPVARDQMASFLARTMNLFVVAGKAVPATS